MALQRAARSTPTLCSTRRARRASSASNIRMPFDTDGIVNAWSRHRLCQLARLRAMADADLFGSTAASSGCIGERPVLFFRIVPILPLAKHIRDTERRLSGLPVFSASPPPVACRRTAAAAWIVYIAQAAA